jgi:L-ornithine Nalpha-acyltransferase
VKGYLRLGARFGDGAVVDHSFGTTDVLVILPTAAISDRYLNYYGSDASRFAS